MFVAFAQTCLNKKLRLLNSSTDFRSRKLNIFQVPPSVPASSIGTQFCGSNTQLSISGYHQSRMRCLPVHHVYGLDVSCRKSRVGEIWRVGHRFLRLDGFFDFSRPEEETLVIIWPSVFLTRNSADDNFSYNKSKSEFYIIYLKKENTHFLDIMLGSFGFRDAFATTNIFEG